VKLAIIVPVLNEGASLHDALAALQIFRARGVRLVVVDGGSVDGTADIAKAHADEVIAAPRGRAAQMNAGAQVCRDADALVFLHADTRLPPEADRLIAEALTERPWGHFDVRIDGRSPWLRLVSVLMNWRARLTGIATGDQTLFVRRKVFEKLGRFEAVPLMEDVELSGRLKKHSRPACIAAHVTTSGRRWDTQGVVRTIALMWQLRAAWWRGADAQTLALRYGYRPRNSAAVAVLAKAPIAGLAKTRLATALRGDGLPLGLNGAARAQRGFTLRTLGTCRAAVTGPITLWCAPDTHHRLFRALNSRLGVRCAAQGPGDIGQRMNHAAHAHFAQAPKMPCMPLLIVGTDCPVLTPAHLQNAADALVDNDAVLIPAEDGGYVLIGLRRALPGVFERIEWSTHRVMEQTRARLTAAGAHWQELPTLWDVDEPADWLRLQNEPKDQQRDRFPETQ
jgi:rSAM/selenodomain-associated transferase 2/rSAM/selenodomain-associated transferase 1